MTHDLLGSLRAGIRTDSRPGSVNIRPVLRTRPQTLDILQHPTRPRIKDPAERCTKGAFMIVIGLFDAGITGHGRQTRQRPLAPCLHRLDRSLPSQVLCSTPH